MLGLYRKLGNYLAIEKKKHQPNTSLAILVRNAHAGFLVAV